MQRRQCRLHDYYAENGHTIAQSCQIRGQRFDLPSMREQHLLIAQLAYSIYREGQKVPGEVYYSQPHNAYIVTAGHRRHLALHALKEPKPLWAVQVNADSVNAVYRHLAGIVGNEQYMPSPRDVLYSMLMAMRAQQVLTGKQPNYHFVLANMPTASSSTAKFIATFFAAAQKDQSGYLWDVIQRRVFTNATQYAKAVAGCGSDVEAICEAVMAFESPQERKVEPRSKPFVRVGKNDTDGWRNVLAAVLTPEGRDIIEALVNNTELTAKDIERALSALAM